MCSITLTSCEYSVKTTYIYIKCNLKLKFKLLGTKSIGLFLDFCIHLCKIILINPINSVKVTGVLKAKQGTQLTTSSPDRTQLTTSPPLEHNSPSSAGRTTWGQWCSVLAKKGLVTPSMTLGGAVVRVVYSLNSESWIVKNGRKSPLYLRGAIRLQQISWCSPNCRWLSMLWSILMLLRRERNCRQLELKVDYSIRAASMYHVA